MRPLSLIEVEGERLLLPVATLAITAIADEDARPPSRHRMERGSDGAARMAG